MGEFQRFKRKGEGAGFQSTNFAGGNPEDKNQQNFAPSPFMNTRENRSTEPPQPEVPEPEINLEELQQEAYDLGAQDAKDQLEPHIDRLEQQINLLQPLIQQLVSIRREALEQAAKDVADIVSMVAKRVVGDSLAYNPDALPTLVINAISQMPEEDEITIKVAADDVDCVKAALDEPYSQRVFACDDIEAGCIVETRFASIDNSLDAVVSGLETAVAEWLESQNA